jgi:hypothetical protein
VQQARFHLRLIRHHSMTWILKGDPTPSGRGQPWNLPPRIAQGGIPISPALQQEEDAWDHEIESLEIPYPQPWLMFRKQQYWARKIPKDV